MATQQTRSGIWHDNYQYILWKHQEDLRTCLVSFHEQVWLCNKFIGRSLQPITCQGLGSNGSGGPYWWCWQVHTWMCHVHLANGFIPMDVRVSSATLKASKAWWKKPSCTSKYLAILGSILFHNPDRVACMSRHCIVHWVNHMEPAWDLQSIQRTWKLQRCVSIRTCVVWGSFKRCTIPFHPGFYGCIFANRDWVNMTKVIKHCRYL